MHFNSLAFLVFAALFFGLWPWLSKRPRSRWAYLTCASFLFYAWWDWRFIFLMAGSGLLDFGVGLGLARFPQRKRWLLGLSVLGNVGSLACFKYLGLFTRSLDTALGYANPEWSFPIVELLLPMGISFYTFQSMSYTIDIYRGQLEPTRDVFQFFAYLTMFAQLVAGPIVRASNLLPQLEEAPKFTAERRWRGLERISYGFFRKCVLADNLAPAVNAAFEQGPVESGAFWWVVTTLFAFQIYCDFSGYTLIALGLGDWLGYEFPQNFRDPYCATSLQDFWKRWHISLSTWFRDYVYIPLGGSRGGAWASHRNMWITMVLSGLWHGAAWGFIVWGALHAAFLSLERITRWPARVAALPGGRVLVTGLVIAQVWVAWVFFRAGSPAQALDVVALLFDPQTMNPSAVAQIETIPLVALALCVLRELYVFAGLHQRAWALACDRGLRPAYVVVALVASVYLRGPGDAFIYFQF